MTNENQTLDGTWWIHGENNPPSSGTLSFDSEKGLKLTIKIPRDRTPEEFWKNFALQPASVSETIYGLDQNRNEVSLFGCRCFPSPQYLGFDIYYIGCLAGITNFRGRWDELSFKAVRLNFTRLGDWMCGAANVVRAFEDGGQSVKFKPDSFWEFNPRTDVQLKIEGKTNTESPSPNKFQIETKYYIWLLFSEAKSAKEIRNEYIPIFLHFLCLLTGERIFVEEISLYKENPIGRDNEEADQQCELLDRKKIKRRSAEPYILSRFIEIKSNFESIMKRWFECHQRMRPVLDLFFAVLSNQDASYQTQFLLLAQALEVYHGRSGRWRNEDIPAEEHAKLKLRALETVADECKDWLKRKINNRRPFRERIDEILNFCSEESKQLIANIPNFSTKVADSRNYYTHYSQQLLKNGQVANGPELVEIGNVLEYLLKICLLKEAGLDGKPIARALAEKGTQKFIHLEKPKS